jgi:DNA-binding NarL/FixJ family response regulator
VLLADDAPVVRQDVKGLLEREGFDVVGEAADGQEAVTLAQTLDPDVAVLDLSMPKLGLSAPRSRAPVGLSRLRLLPSPEDT